jgi:Rod binding domain-containing protein
MAVVDPAVLAGCQQFEAVLVRPLLDQLHLGRTATLDSGDASGQDDNTGAADLVGSLFADALAVALVRAGGLGLARDLAQALAERRP